MNMQDKQTIIIELVKSLNAGNTSYSQDRVKIAIQQYNQLVDYEIVKGPKVKV